MDLNDEILAITRRYAREAARIITDVAGPG